MVSKGVNNIAENNNENGGEAPRRVDYDLKYHPEDPSIKHDVYSPEYDLDLPQNSIIYQSSILENKPLLMVCITMYNEPFRQVVESMAGIYRAYYELVNWNKEYLNKVQVVIVADGYDRLGKDLLESFEGAGIYNSFASNAYKSAEMTSDKTGHNIRFKSKQISFSKIV